MLRPTRRLVADHVIPLEKRPDLALDRANLVPACVPCNTRRGRNAKLPDPLPLHRLAPTPTDQPLRGDALADRLSATSDGARRPAGVPLRRKAPGPQGLPGVRSPNATRAAACAMSRPDSWATIPASRSGSG